MSDPDLAFVTAVLERTRDRLGAAACSFAAVDGGELEFVAASGVGAEQVVGLRLPLGRGLAGYVVVSGQALAVGDVRADRRFDLETAQSTGLVPTTILAVPVEDDEGAFGVIEVLDRRPGARDLEVAGEAARQIAALLSGGATQAPAGILDDPGLSELVELVAAFRDRPAPQRSRAAAALRAILVGPV